MSANCGKGFKLSIARERTKRNLFNGIFPDTMGKYLNSVTLENLPNNY